MSYYEMMFLLFKVIIYISERTSIIWEISGDAASFRKTKVLVQLGRGGEGGTSENYGGGVQHA